MTDKVTRLELLRVLSSDASKLFAARERCATIHHTTDIRASGDEVEVTVRQMIREKVPASHHVGHGHIVDATLASSPQFDVILSDISAPILFKTENGTEYFPYESVHAIGGIKSTYKNGHVQEFVEQIGEVKRDLKRDPTPKTYIGNGVSIGGNMATSEPRSYRNPIFSFMLCVNGEKFDVTHIAELFRTTAAGDLPNVICLLDRGIVVNAQILPEPNENGQYQIGPLNLAPEFNAELAGGNGRWCFIPFGDENIRAASNLGFLWFALIHHLQASVLMRTDMLVYLNRLFTFTSASAF